MLKLFFVIFANFHRAPDIVPKMRYMADHPQKYSEAERYDMMRHCIDLMNKSVSYTHLGMSHLGIQILYDMFNRMDDVLCERVYSPWPDLHEIMKQENIPLFGLESQEPIKDFDFVRCV